MDVTTREYALALDANDPLAKYRQKFLITDPEVSYLDGNSLGRLPQETIKVVNDFLTLEWGREVVTGWGHWIDEAQSTGDLLGRAALGAGPGQVLIGDTTTVNFYQLCLAAIQSKPNRKTIITDAANFPTDRYVLQGIAKQFDLNLVIIDNETPGNAEFERITPEILSKYLNDDVALVTLEVVQYRSGARNPIKEITDLVRKHGAWMLWDCSHSGGAISMDFDANGVDLAVGCTYKYGNSGPGAPAWLYVNKKVQAELQVPIQGWFAQENQFAMGPNFERTPGIRGFRIASPGIMTIRCVDVAFKMIEDAGIQAIEEKCAKGTGMMIALYDAWLKDLGFELITTRNAKERGGHISLVHKDAAEIAVAMRKLINVIPDYREPNSIRLAISPLPTSYTEVWDGFSRLRDLVATKKYQGINKDNSRVT